MQKIFPLISTRSGRFNKPQKIESITFPVALSLYSPKAPQAN